MGHNVITADRNPAAEKEIRLPNLEPAENPETAEIMFKKLETKARALRALEASVYKKMTTLGQLINRAEVLEKRLQGSETFVSAVEKKTAELEQLVQRAQALEKKLQSNETLVTIMDKMTDELYQLVQRAEVLEKKIQSGEVGVSILNQKMTALERLVQGTEILKTANRGTNRWQEIIALSGKGLASREIAEVLDMPQGEVELILDLDLKKA